MVNPTEYLPRSYRARVSTYWWLARWPYLKFILREGSSVFVAWVVVVTLVGIGALRHGPARYSEFEEWLRTPLVVALNAVSFVFVVFHAVTWFNLAPKAMAVRVRGKRLPAFALAAPNYAAWIAISFLVAWILLRG
jgi:fumarate reductase subunit C